MDLVRIEGRGAPRAQISRRRRSRTDGGATSGGRKGKPAGSRQIASYGGGARVGATLNYVSRGGELKEAVPVLGSRSG